MASFLDYYKIILDKVSFDPALLKKEYQKAINNLHTHEIGDLNQYVSSRGFQGILNEPLKNGPRQT
jgi:hypothetical protein